MVPKSLLLAILGAFSLVVSLQADTSYKNYPFKDQVKLDGKDDESVWSKLKYSDAFNEIKGKKSRFKTLFKLYSDKSHLFIFIKIHGQELKAITSSGSNKRKFSGDRHVIYLSPFPIVDDHYRITINYKGEISSCFVPTKAGHSFPYSAKVDKNWKSQATCGISQNKGSIGFEIKMPLRPLGLQKNIFHKFGLNIVRYATYEEVDKNNKKKRRMEISSWGKTKGELWNTRYFGAILGPLFKDKSFAGKWDLNNLDQMTNGMTALLKSLDIYYKATIAYKYHIPEGTEINGDISNFDHVPFPQYPVKADGYFRFYNAYKYQPYQDLGNHIINKIYQAYAETKDANGKNFLLWNNLMALDGKVHGYDSGPKMSAFQRGKIPYDQSKNNFSIKDVMFQEGMGQGFYDLSKIKESLEPTIINKICEMLKGTLEFLHQPYVLIDNGNEYYWRIDSFSTQVIKAYDKKLKNSDWSLLGQDIVLMIMALHRFDQKLSQPYLKSLEKFSRFYIENRWQISERNHHNPHKPHNIFKLDHRMLSLGKFAKEQQLIQFKFLIDWLQEYLPSMYSKLPKVEYSESGATRNSWSTLGILEIYRELDDKSKFQSFWKKCFTENMTPIGIYQGHRVVEMNFSSYPLYFDYAKKAFDSKLLSEKEYLTAIKKMFYFYGNPRIHRNNIKYALDLLPEYRTRPMWAHTPYDCYVEGVLPEGIYANGSSQAFYSIFGNYAKDEFFKSRAEHGRYEYDFRYYQYTAPFQFHSDRYSYGQAESICLAKMEKSIVDLNDLKITNKKEKNFEFTITTPNEPKGIPVFGHLDITNLIFKNNSAKQLTNYKILKVEMHQKKIPFKDYHIFEYKKIFSKEDKAKLVFGLWSPGPNAKCKIKVTLIKKKMNYYFGYIAKTEAD
ncbi:MAG: hypothetical protein COA79_01425 [Planctomycetota bacterium]|nr:MAG: hypothetical protein COA79_01425 [Planctomycetota bacterium]